jgi:hypothetical protein
MALFNATVLDAWKRLEAQVGVLPRRLDHFDTGFVFRTCCQWRVGVGVPKHREFEPAGGVVEGDEVTSAGDWSRRLSPGQRTEMSLSLPSGTKRSRSA